MSRAPVIVDTNVVVAGLLTGSDASAVARILDGMLAAAFPFVVSEALLAEYRAALVRPGIRRLHGLTIAQVETILTDLAQHTIVLTRVAAPRAPDPGDQLLRALLAARDDLLLVTGDKLLLADRTMRGRVGRRARSRGADERPDAEGTATIAIRRSDEATSGDLYSRIWYQMTSKLRAISGGRCKYSKDRRFHACQIHRQ